MLEALQAASPNRFRGIRHTVTWDPHPELARREQEGVLATAAFRAGAHVLARMGLSLDTGLYFPQLPELAAFAQAVPELTIILNHLGGLTRIGPYANRDDEVLATWRRGLAAVAACPNVSLKLGGIGMPRLGFDWHERATPIGSEELATAMAPFMTSCIEQFGPDRCMFESNFRRTRSRFRTTSCSTPSNGFPRGTRLRSARPCSMTRRCGLTGSGTCKGAPTALEVAWVSPHSQVLHADNCTVPGNGVFHASLSLCTLHGVTITCGDVQSTRGIPSNVAEDDSTAMPHEAMTRVGS